MNRLDKNIIVNDNADQFIQQCLKNWATEQQPPREIRSRLLHNASPFYLKLFSASSVEEENIPISPFAPYRLQLNRRIDARGQTQLWAWHMTMTSLHFA